MIRRIDLRSAATGRTPGEPFDYRTALPRADFDVEAAVPATHAICEEVRTRGLEAILEMSQKFDGVTQSDIRVPVEEMTRALEELDPAIRAGLEESVRRLRVASEAELEQDVVTDLGPGARVVHRKVPVGRVGLYVPGGLAPLVSSVLMNVVPAQVAGVPSLALASPPQQEFGGLPHPTILAACALLGVEEVYAVGGAQAIAMFAYGTGPCAKVDLVTGPGNIWVVTAKRLLKGLVGVDSEAGPTEVAILADET
ncbi:histidinol dehydrogenase, partial [Nocardioides sp.]|uniref:histidinol dehydrogenase n=2 Tax=Nocardioides TaxID=1839 RepID=UPI0035125614